MTNLDEVNPDWMHQGREPVKLSPEFKRAVEERVGPISNQSHDSPSDKTPTERLVSTWRRLFS